MMTQNLLNGPQAQERKTPASRIIIAGASGFIGTALHTRLHEQGYDVPSCTGAVGRHRGTPQKENLMKVFFLVVLLWSACQGQA